MPGAERTSRLLWVGVCCLTACGCGLGSGSPPSLPAPRTADRGPVVARAGEVQIHARDVGPLAQWALAFRREQGLETPAPRTAGERLALAAETAALAAAGSAIQMDPGMREERTRRLLARVFADRFIAGVEKRPVSEEDLLRIHREQIEQYKQEGESEIFEPTVADIATIAVGHFPDLEPPGPGERPFVDREAAAELIERIRAACLAPTADGEPVASDLDAFLDVGVRFQRTHPTVRLQQTPGAPLHPALSRLPKALLEAIGRLAEPGEVSPPVWTPGGVYLARRGLLVPGRGEDPQQVRAALENLVRRETRRKEFARLIRWLREQYEVETWPRRLRAGETKARSGD